MSKTNSDRALDDNALCVQSTMIAPIPKPQPQHQQQLTSRYGIPLKRNPSLSNSTASSVTNGTYPSRRSLGGSTSSDSKEKMSADEILSSTKYAFSARKTWTKEEVRQAKNVKLVKSVKKKPQSKLLQGSPNKYNFPSREECLRRLGSPVKGAKEDAERLLQNKSAKRVLNTDDCEQKNYRSKRTSPRLKNPGASGSKSISTDDLDLDTPNNAGIEITATSASKLPSNPTKQSAAESVSILLDTYSASLGGEKNAWEVVQLLPPLLDYLEKNDEHRNIVHGGLSQFVESVESIKSRVMNRNNSNIDNDQNSHEKLLHIVQIQIWVRIMMWNFSREEGWSLLKQLVGSETEGENGQSKRKGKKKKDKKKSKSKVDLSPRQSFVQDIIKLFELVPYVLPPSMDFAQWLKDTLTCGFQQSLPEFGMEILDHFEIEFVSHAAGETGEIGAVVEKTEISSSSDAQSQSSIVAKEGSKLTAKGKTQQQAYFSSLARKPLNVNADGEAATITSDATIAARSHRSTCTGSSKTSTQSDKEADATLFKTSVSLTAAVPKRKENPFLKDSARGVYVGSHFSSKLSNISSLFREVKAPPKPKPTVVTAKRKAPLEENNFAAIKSKSTLLAAQMPPDNSTSIKPSSALEFVNKKYNTSHKPFCLPSETPRKRLKPVPPSRHPAINLLSVNKYVAATPLQVVGETPAKQTAARSFASRDASGNMSAAEAAANNSQIVGATPLQIIGETPHSKLPRNAARRLRPNSLDNVFVRHSLDMIHGSSGGSCFGLSPIMPQQGNCPKSAPKDGKKKWI